MNCDKVQYDTRGEAMRSNIHLTRRKHGRKHRYTAYECPQCGKFHITTVSRTLHQSNRNGKNSFRYDRNRAFRVNSKKRKRHGGKDKET